MKPTKPNYPIQSILALRGGKLTTNPVNTKAMNEDKDYSIVPYPFSITRIASNDEYERKGTDRNKHKHSLTSAKNRKKRKKSKRN